MATVVSTNNPFKKQPISEAVFISNMRRFSKLNYLSGNLLDKYVAATKKNEADIERTLKLQTSSDLPIVRAMDLSKQDNGDEVIFNLVNPVQAYPIMGDEIAEGRGTGLTFTGHRFRINQARFPIETGGTMTNIRSPIEFKKIAYPIAVELMNAYTDQSALVHLAGARGYHHTIDWVLPLQGDPQFNKVMVNPIQAPTANRHFVANGEGVNLFAKQVNAGALDIQSTDILTMDTVNAMKNVLDNMTCPPPNISIPKDKAAKDNPLRVMFVSPAQYNQFAQNKEFQKFKAEAYARASQAANHPLFTGEVGIWNNFLICKMPLPIRFYAGDDIRYCTDGSGIETTVKVPAGFRVNGVDEFAIDRAIILGGAALGEAFGSSNLSNLPFFHGEHKFDYGNRLEVMYGTIRGVAKNRFNVDMGNGFEMTDYGVVVVDTVVDLKGIA
ncbi:MAG: N4-gp56 family major capsid protein [Neisseriaceae bacterium]|nr:N4-gp56 family major capsid protein [Neisseriaceae bacterium]